MIRLNGNKIFMTRGDTLRLEVRVTVDGEEYSPSDGDVVRFALKREAMNMQRSRYLDSEPLILKTIPNDTMTLELNPEDTKELGFGLYDYDIQITFADGDVSTFISDKLELMREVE